jgi:hypothetical protein
MWLAGAAPALSRWCTVKGRAARATGTHVAFLIACIACMFFVKTSGAMQTARANVKVAEMQRTLQCFEDTLVERAIPVDEVDVQVVSPTVRAPDGATSSDKVLHVDVRTDLAEMANMLVRQLVPAAAAGPTLGIRRELHRACLQGS